MSESRKNRGTNFTSRERHLLVRLVSGRTEVIENKKTDNVSIRRKEIAWMEVAEEFNGHAAVSVRTVKQLRNCYENSKRRLKKKMLEDKIDFHSVNVDGEIPSNLDIETDNQLMSIMREQADPLHMVCENESSNQDDPAPANNDSDEEDDEMDSEIMESSTLTNRNDDVIILNNIEPIVTIAGGEEESEPSPSHAGGKWRERNRQHLRRLKYLKAAKSRDNMASLINERRSVLQEELQMLREKHAEEMLILKMKKENEEQMVREKHAEEDVFSKESFESLDIHKYIVSNLKQNFGITETTQVQQMSIPILLQGNDALIRSQTGSGKTLAYAIPILHMLQQFEPKITRADGIKALVVIPTRELALQTYECFNKLIRSFAWLVPGLLVGGEKKKSEKARLRKGINILIGTPGRLLDHVENTKCVNLSTVQWFVLDEADRLLDMGYEKDVASLVNALESQQSGFNRPSFRRQTILLSATMTPKVERLAGLTLKEPSRIDALSGGGGGVEGGADQMTIPKSLKQTYIVTPPKLRLVTMAAIIHGKCQIEQGSRKMIVFMATQDMVDYHTELLTTVLNGSAEFFKLHGSMTQSERTSIFKTFRAAESGVLFCTDVAARGLDLPNVDWIIQYTAPTTPSDYVHRVGRTARAGLSGSALIFLAPSELPFITMLEQKNIKLTEETMDNHLNNLRLLPLEGADEFQRDRRVGGPTTEAAATALQLQFENSLYDQKKLHGLACKAYQSWVRFYASYPRESREAFDFKSLHLGHYAKSFALRDPPSTIKGMTNSKNEDQHNGYKERFNRSAKKPKQVKTKKFSEFDSGISFKKKKNKNDS